MVKEGKRDFDAAAASWDEEPRRVQLALDVAEAIRREVPLRPDMEALDYGCGSGLVTLGLQPLVKRITGADSSQGMLDVLRRKVEAGGIANVETKLLDLEQMESLGGSYDLIVSSMTLHHVGDVAALIGELVEGLRPGGWLALADLEQEDGSFHDDATGVLHHGFARDFFGSEFAKNGLGNVSIVTAATIEKARPEGKRRYNVILGVGKKGV